MDPVAQDLALIVYTANCSSNLVDGIAVDDTGGPGVAESITITTMPAGFYHIVVDGYSTGGVPPGPSDAYTLSVTGATQPNGPTAAHVSVGGRVVNAIGRGIYGVRVSIAGSTGETRTAMTNPFGYYSFDDVEVGQGYTLQVSDKRYQFTNPTQFITVFDAVEDLNFVAEP
jgi:hypothetical protein